MRPAATRWLQKSRRHKNTDGRRNHCGNTPRHARAGRHTWLHLVGATTLDTPDCGDTPCHSDQGDRPGLVVWLTGHT
eukprot:364888-Chlamydomonas_euryale.AAC.4